MAEKWPNTEKEMEIRKRTQDVLVGVLPVLPATGPVSMLYSPCHSEHWDTSFKDKRVWSCPNGGAWSHGPKVDRRWIEDG